MSLTLVRDSGDDIFVSLTVYWIEKQPIVLRLLTNDNNDKFLPNQRGID